MEKCYVKSCLKRVLATCSCNDQKIFICKKHLHDHLTDEANNKHVIDALLMTIPYGKNEELILNSLLSMKNISILQTTIKTQAFKLINQIAHSCNSALSKLAAIKKQFITLFNDSIREEKVNKMLIQEYLGLYISDNSFQFTQQCEAIFGSISKLFDFKPITSINIHKNVYYEDKFAFFCKSSDTKLISIDLDSMKSSKVEFMPMAYIDFQSCRIDKNKFFINGGGERNNTYLLDFESNKFEILPSPEKNRDGGCVFKDNIVYIFGGYRDKQKLSECLGFEIEVKRWYDLANLPEASIYNQVAILRNEIIVSGYSLSKAYEYKNNAFSDILTLTPDQYKIVCTGWILTKQFIYENTTDNKTWLAHNSNLDFVRNYSSLVFYTEKYIYFINISYTLFRLNTITKCIESIAYT